MSPQTGRQQEAEAFHRNKLPCLWSWGQLGYRVDGWGTRNSISGDGKKLLFFLKSRVRIQSPAASSGISIGGPIGGFIAGSDISQGLKLTIRFHLLPRLRMHGAVPLLPHMPARRGA